jgi:hypothetical protein
MQSFEYNGLQTREHVFERSIVRKIAPVLSFLYDDEKKLDVEYTRRRLKDALARIRRFQFQTNCTCNV